MMPMPYRRLIRNFDYFLLAILLAICALGTIVLYSTAQGLDGTAEALHFMQRQAIILGAGFFLMFVICFIDYINFVNWARYFYLASLFLLALVLIPGVGQSEYGATRWIPIGFFNLQPSEVAKIALIIFLAKVLSEKEGPFDSFKDMLPALAITAAPMALIFLQPDLGTALVFVAVLLGMLYAAGVAGRYLAALIGAGVAVMPLFWFFLLEDYQKMRLMVFLNPDMDPTGSGWQLLQSMICIGSGGLLGKGLFNSTQVRLQFLPFPKTDFIFSVLGEELGFAGAVGLLVLF
ncbi:MAG TPA: FtsW/RodA/SpoVE family cell cycle protein, partial [Bacillota bacterium]|nr:FtsW/RodA/SpoVE family cell cycle protein [Bacillota bacterium]